MRNPKWHRDEIILALDLYFKIEPGQIHTKNPEVIALSEVLNKLPIHEERPDVLKFRNQNGVSLKLSNFLAIDPDSRRKGMQAHSRLDKEIFEEFVNGKTELSKIANQIKSTVNSSSLNLRLFSVENEEEVNTVKEGQVIYKLHKYRERNSKIIRSKKDRYFKTNGKLDCEVCGFDFYLKYGELGKGFIECHHKKPLSELEPNTETKLSDLALVCANCHRMLHKEISTLNIDDLKLKIRLIV
ncbi:5-methylcytosine-specific restriction enzyme A [Arenibacter palladensis]|uniref:5-methylcytosine-specific restriction enzyme A n=1 Tax=Arenibacter palladensis TaxID=237373 RepID=A0A1M4U9G7_9FLAO|nr:HNH endonuclease [Arenibacter palladensis]SHE53365.1 5-methylcytosine-specific restriction enzyme A [Arenibacter palladensis]